MSKRSRRTTMSSEEYQRCITDEGRTFIRCDRAGNPDPHGDHWKMRDDLFAAMIAGETE